MAYAQSYSSLQRVQRSQDARMNERASSHLNRSAMEIQPYKFDPEDNVGLLTENSIIKQHVECKIENKEKLKQVKNLEELIKFNIKTVADKMVEDGVMVTSQSQKKGLYALRKVCDPLLASSALPQITKKQSKRTTSHQNRGTALDRLMRNQKTALVAEESDSLMQDSIMVSNSKESVGMQAKATGKEYLPSISENKIDLTEDSIQKKSISALNDVLAVQLDENDPIRKLQKYFGAGHSDAYGDGRESQSAGYGATTNQRRKAPKHKNYIMQRYENQKKIRQDIRAQSQASREALSMSQSRVQNPNTSLERSNLNEQSSFKNFGDSLDQGSMSLDRPMHLDLKKLEESYQQQLNYLTRTAPDAVENPFQRKSDVSHQLEEAKALQELAGLQAESSIFAQKVQQYEDAANDRGLAKNRPANLDPNQFRQKVKKVFAKVDDVPPGSVETQFLTNQETQQASPKPNSVANMNRDLSETNEEISSERFSDDSIDRLVYGQDQAAQKRSQKELARLQAQEEELQRQELERALDAQISDNAMTEEQQNLMREYLKSQYLGEQAKNPISILSKVAAIKSKDYITYTPQQLKLYNIMHGQNESQNRLQIMRQKRDAYNSQKPLPRAGQLKPGLVRNIPVKQAPFSTKQFVEDLQKGEYDTEIKPSDKLPKISFKTQSQPKQIFASSSLEIQPATRQVKLAKQSVAKKQKVKRGSAKSIAHDQSTSTNDVEQTYGTNQRRHTYFKIDPDSVRGSQIKEAFEQTQSTSKLDAQQYQVTYPAIITGEKSPKSGGRIGSPFRQKNNLRSQHGPLETSSSLPHSLQNNEEVPLSRDSRRIMIEANQYNENQAGIDEVQTVKIKDSGLSGPFKQKRVSSVQDGESGQSSAVGQQLDVNQRTQIKLNQQHSPRLSHDVNTQTDTNNSARRNQGVEPVAARPVDKEMQYASATNSVKSPPTSGAQQIVSSYAEESHVQTYQTNLISKRESFGTIPIDENIPVEDNADETTMPKANTKGETKIEVVNQLYSNLQTEEVPVGVADNQSIGTKEARVSTTGSFRDPVIGTTSALSKDDQSARRSSAGASPKQPVSSAGPSLSVQIRHQSNSNVTSTKGIANVTSSDYQDHLVGGHVPPSIVEHTPEDTEMSTQPNLTVGANRFIFEQQSNAEVIGIVEGKHEGYETANEGMNRSRATFVNDVFNQMRQGRPGWHAKRFKKFPRFSIFLNRTEDQDHMEQNYISLNSRILSYLAQPDPNQSDYPALEEDSQNEEQIQEQQPMTELIIQPHRAGSDSAIGALAEQEHGTLDDNNARLSRHTLQENPTQKTLEGTKISAHSSVGEGTGDETYNDSKILAPFQSSQQISTDKQNASSHAMLADPSSYGDDAAGPQYVEADYNGGVEQTNMIDPFDRVLLLKYIDNAILTSFRTLSKQNNMISHTLKVVHQRFTPTIMNKRIQKMYKKAHGALYPVSEADGNETSTDEEYEVRAHDPSRMKQILSKQATNQSSQILGKDLEAVRYYQDDKMSRTGGTLNPLVGQKSMLHDGLKEQRTNRTKIGADESRRSSRQKQNLVVYKMNTRKPDSQEGMSEEILGKRSTSGPVSVRNGIPEDPLVSTSQAIKGATKDKNINNTADTEQDEKINNNSSADGVDIGQKEWNDMINSDTRTQPLDGQLFGTRTQDFRILGSGRTQQKQSSDTLVIDGKGSKQQEQMNAQKSQPATNEPDTALNSQTKQKVQGNQKSVASVDIATKKEKIQTLSKYRDRDSNEIIMVSGGKLATLKAVSTATTPAQPAVERQPHIMRHQEVKIKVVNPLDYFQPHVGYSESAEYVSRQGFGKSKLVVGRNKGPAQSPGPSQAKKGRVSGTVNNATFTVLVQDPAANPSQKIPQSESAIEMSNQPTTSHMEMVPPETGVASAGLIVSEDTLIARSEFENTLNRILNQTKETHGKQNLDLKVPTSPVKIPVNKPKVKDQELIEHYNRYSVQIGKTLNQDPSYSSHAGVGLQEPQAHQKEGPQTVAMSQNENTFDTPYQVTFPDDIPPDVYNRDQQGASSGKLLSGNHHIHSHPNLRKENNEAMAISQFNLANQAIVTKEELIAGSPEERKDLKVITTSNIGVIEEKESMDGTRVPMRNPESSVASEAASQSAQELEPTPDQISVQPIKQIAMVTAKQFSKTSGDGLEAPAEGWNVPPTTQGGHQLSSLNRTIQSQESEPIEVQRKPQTGERSQKTVITLTKNSHSDGQPIGIQTAIYHHGPEEANPNPYQNAGEEIAERVVQPKPSHVLKAMISDLYEKEKKFIYSKAAAREECIGNKNVIFNLEKSHGVDKHYQINKNDQKVRRAIADSIDFIKDPKFRDGSYLAGQRAEIKRIQSKPRAPLERSYAGAKQRRKEQ